MASNQNKDKNILKIGLYKIFFSITDNVKSYKVDKERNCVLGITMVGRQTSLLIIIWMRAIRVWKEY